MLTAGYSILVTHQQNMEEKMETTKKHPHPWAGRGSCSRAVRESMKPDTKGAIVERIRNREILVQVRSERKQKFPVITTENAQTVLDWQERRIDELKKRRKRGADKN